MSHFSGKYHVFPVKASLYAVKQRTIAVPHNFQKPLQGNT